MSDRRLPPGTTTWIQDRAKEIATCLALALLAAAVCACIAMLFSLVKMLWRLAP